MVLIVLSIAIPQNSQAQVIINEVTAANYSGLQWSDFSGPEDWVELKNTSGTEQDIGGYWLSDDLDNPMKYEIASGTVIPPNGYYLFYLSDLDSMADDSEFPHTNFNLTQLKGESIVFSSPDGGVLDSFHFDELVYLLADHSFALDSELNWQIAQEPTPLSENNTAMYSTYSFMPESLTPAGYYEGSITVSLIGSDPIYYTLDGQEPTSSDLLYEAPIQIDETTVLKARIIPEIPDILPGRVMTNTYFIGDDQHEMQVVSISGPTLDDGDWSGDEHMHIEFFDENGNFIQEATGDSNKHGHDSNAFPQRGFDFVCRDELGYTRELVFPEPLFENSSERTDFQRLIFKCGGSENYPYGAPGSTALRDMYNHLLAEKCDMNIDVRTGEFCALYINGEYWGLYSFREKVDDRDFMKYRHEQAKYTVDLIKTWGGTWVEMGDPDCVETWDDLVDFATQNDMTDVSNYDYIPVILEIHSLIDFFILNSTAVNRSWLNWDISWWKGEYFDSEDTAWRYALWDTDYTWGFGPNFTGIPDMTDEAGHFDYLTLGDPGGQGHVPLINALFNNDEFDEEYMNRRTALQNGCFNCDEMLGLLDSLVMVIEPEMDRHVERWGGDTVEWLENIIELGVFIAEQCGEDQEIESVDEIELDLEVYPNPVQSELQIEGEHYGPWQLFGLHGQVVLAGLKNDYREVIDLSRLDTGLYILKLNESRFEVVKY